MKALKPKYKKKGRQYNKLFDQCIAAGKQQCRQDGEHNATALFGLRLHVAPISAIAHAEILGTPGLCRKGQMAASLAA